MISMAIHLSSIKSIVEMFHKLPRTLGSGHTSKCIEVNFSSFSYRHHQYLLSASLVTIEELKKTLNKLIDSCGSTSASIRKIQLFDKEINPFISNRHSRCSTRFLEHSTEDDTRRRMRIILKVPLALGRISFFRWLYLLL